MLPSHAKKPPESSGSSFCSTSSMLPAEYSEVKSFSGLTFFWNGTLRSVSVVPGCSATA